jgi:hypothetical protein
MYQQHVGARRINTLPWPSQRNQVVAVRHR